MADFAGELAERCVEAHKDQNGADFLHLRDRSRASILSVSPEAVHWPIVTLLGRVRGAVAGFAEAGIEEGRRLGWAEALETVAGEAARRRGAYELAAASAERARLDWVAAEAVRDALSAAAPGGER